MKLLIQMPLCCALAICLTSPAAAQSGDPTKPVPSARAKVLTGKERLGPKWTDEQRIDNCNVPADKRGTKTRSVLCRDHPTN
ncbi:hypothetical protein QA641_13040 [Bradyrhizobium sp. CB1650]|uniref:hypothetical protein n=1 Tax=Bradyrhizobium sp. CB1650 TaxID=3039153 RepID=UPI002435F6F6|nr:hypothetical protein [Bradyrhizobium sp. CB1650]WGD54749.1 hypothetical protein QA641_13040 [Bradyrhizobium sp. CB1650]